MRIAILTTDTPHHRYFIREFVARAPHGCKVVLTIFETKGYPWKSKARRYFSTNLPNVWRAAVLNPYIQPRGFGRAVDRFENNLFFPGGENTLPKSGTFESVGSANDPESLQLIARAQPDLLLVYGTGLLKPSVFDSIPLGAINAHGGLLPHYRGLDTNLWATYSGRPDEMAITLHRVNQRIDDGEIYLQERLLPRSDLSVTTIRGFTAVQCTSMFVELVDRLAKGTIVSTPQSGESEYFTPMPFLLKCRTNSVLKSWAAANSVKLRRP